MPEKDCVYTVTHQYDGGRDTYFVRSKHRGLDALDLIVHEPDVYEPHKDGEEVICTPTEAPLQDLIDAAPDRERSGFLASLQPIPKADHAARARVLGDLPEDVLALSGLFRIRA